MRSASRTEQVLQVMRVLAWVAFVGLCIDGGALLVSFSISLFNPEIARNLYFGMDLYELRQISLYHYTAFTLITVALSGLKAFMVLLVIQALNKVRLQNPFTPGMARLLERISFVLLAIYLGSLLSRGYSDWIFKISGDLYRNEISGGFVFAAGLVFIIAQIFKRGIEIQAENELTI